MLHRFILITLFFMLTSCSFFQVHKQTIIQGNEFNNKQIDELRIGMSKEEVIAIMGHPILTSPFWRKTKTYVYTYDNHKSAPMKKQVVLEFTNDSLSNIRQ